jgi:uroporphyrin-III C-methyltransferase / precorrin-2 dehydrogenase / sirohydrochlorin ferrochelatase
MDDSGSARGPKQPILLDLCGRPVVVVGGGQVAERKVEGLLECGACVTLISPEVTPAIEQWAEAGAIRLERRRFLPGDLGHARLAYAATSDPEVNQAVRAEADDKSIWLNVVDQPALCDFFVPALVRRGDLTVAVSTNGASPALARRIREELERRFGPEYETALRELRGLRDACQAEGRSIADERQRVAGVIERLAGEDQTDREPVGTVYLVGAGPGDPELITAKGKACLERADVVVCDSLVDPRLLDCCRPDALRIVTGCAGDRHGMPHADIRQMLIAEARAGHTVVRLKGGDPFIFNHGGDEAEELAKAGIPFVVVPGVTAGVAVPAYAGIAVTHRKFGSELVFLTGHPPEVEGHAAIEWGRYAHSSATLVIYIPRDNLPAIARALIARGRDPGCPVAIIYGGTTDRQRTLVTTLTEVAGPGQAAEGQIPALAVIGEVVRLRETLRWFREAPGPAAGGIG